jgi:aerobic carbon-monoxide dehydrogenase small subunit
VLEGRGVPVTNTITLAMTVNGRPVSASGGDHFTLLRWLRDVLGVLDPKYGCGEGACGACTVLVDGDAVSSCLVLAAQAEGADIRTASGLTEADGRLNALQQSFLDHGAAQCGFCTPGMLMAATELLQPPGDLDRETIRAALHGNLCRCTGYDAIVSAIEAVARGGR